ncbi:capsule assembly Wzi family protein [Pontibacter sp. G13]|uniref:capsule assembly Wzi family protein n=1 Tax=Pontibacter sp. G13 TaxID=3074898 RepID=UPI002889320D|nr:capsule assembly Wzi family protein [Pontibacter sp. G13]WNJ20399.1 capsule assembly Wzi family protein [Pontibacter sp. G13]
MRKTSCLIVCLLMGVQLLFSQESDIPAGHDIYRFMDRLEIKSPTNELPFSVLRPYSREMLREWFASYPTDHLSPQELARFNNWRYQIDDTLAISQNQRGVWGLFYRNQRDFYTVQTKNFRLIANPVFHTAAGIDRTNLDTALDPTLPIYTNSRGAMIRGSLMDKVGFYTEVVDNIARLPQYQYDPFVRQNWIQGEGFVKRFGTDKNGVDYFSTRAYVTYSPIKSLRLKFGKDRAFWGNGHQSLLLSDVAPDHLLFDATLRIWKLEYKVMFTQMIDFIRNRNDDEGTHPRKYGAFHYVGYQPNRHFSIGIFESVVYNTWQANGRRGFELQYLNPVIFYRAIEQYIGSPDNSLLGLNVKANFLQRFQFYGQVLLDDYSFGQRNNGSGYWGNKVGLQGGIKYVSALGIDGLDLQIEYNQVRPYTYQHFAISSNYTHYGQSLGHASGANLRDFHFIGYYQPNPRWHLFGSYSYLIKGLDQDGINYGGDAGISSLADRLGDFDHFVAQGESYVVHQAFGRISRQLFKGDMYLEMESRYRRMNDDQSLTFMAGLRLNMVGRTVK